MDKRFSSLFSITEDQAIKLLQTPLEQLEDPSDRYAAASNLVYFKSERSIQALIEAIENCDDQLYNRITRRKAIETLGRFKADQALDVICRCLGDSDCYTVENTVWAIGQIGTQEQKILQEITDLLNKTGQNYRVIIQNLAKLNYQPATEVIKKFIDSEDLCIASSALSAMAILTRDFSQVYRILEFLQSDSVNVRRASIQDLMDLNYYDAIAEIACCPVSLVFRLRAIRSIGESAINQGLKTFTDIEPYLDQVIRDHPSDLKLVHEYDQNPTLEFLIGELYHTDFGRCYLASKTLLENYSPVLGEALIKTYDELAHNDYGGHYHVMKLFGWLKYEPASELLIESLQNQAPQFQKSRGAAAIALGILGNKNVIPLLKDNLTTNIFDLKYACLMALNQLDNVEGKAIAINDSDLLIRAKAGMVNSY
ncbi:HEAT repeat domain-containing protein [Geminocystis sp. GBBB08]|uniref:HEAT repeat domain-containing protein n=1 Tax=Geminocystis sp. GBBB08 TaxID=2604140 RepID=UPI0027E2DC0D|nr:HEAT repeat domain-containing protein [Geminocystis sp. GBBB08]MBL1210060.1 HEAT repeat domain-containing protein [Geminocystis sp. GBBB08]